MNTEYTRGTITNRAIYSGPYHGNGITESDITPAVSPSLPYSSDAARQFPKYDRRFNLCRPIDVLYIGKYLCFQGGLGRLAA